MTNICPRLNCTILGRHKHEQGLSIEHQAVAKSPYDRRHQRWRRMVLARHPLCLECLRLGHTVSATEADHIIPLSMGGGWSIGNGQGLCKSHHSQKTRSESE